MGLMMNLLLGVLVAAAVVGKATAATYVVGDNQGWTVPNAPTDYSTWASKYVFRVGDVLVFNFLSGQHDVAQVSKAAFDGCSSINPIMLATVGPSAINISTTGEHYYICTFGTHCTLGQKLAINVTTTPSPTPTPAPASAPMVPVPNPTMAPTPSMMTPPPSGSPAPAPAMGSPAPAPAMGSPTPSPMGMGPMGPAPSSAPTPGSMRPMGPAPSSMTSPGSMGPPAPPSSATVSTMSAALAVLTIVAFGLTM